MKFRLLVLVQVALSCSLFGSIPCYEDLISRTITALGNIELLTSPSFTNEVSAFRIDHSDVQSQYASQVAESFALLWRFEGEGDLNALERQICLASNVAHSAYLPVDSWLHVTGEFAYLCGLNARGRSEEGFVVTTNALKRMTDNPPNMSTTNFWMAVMAREGCTNVSPQSVFQMNAALEMLRQRRFDEVAVYTNSLPLGLLRVIRGE